ncbi:hypothetical protein J2X46_000578 [Nocardioides sp. BE266]|uniref:hypothetical protein n=1 Tax=Nocardioides sp. BE266 TaxID=2817725 RepID=UPI00285FFE72|nr:hypothetical protein [Nocardioides sp. BE266]MDR7251606.1 hypothetical protein [Nocardioides sp. BE266]
MILPTDLPREVAERAVQPGFDTVLDQARSARRRRRRTTIASGMAAAAVVGGIAWGTGPGSDGGPDPAGSSRSQAPTEITGSVDPDLPAGVHRILSGDMVDPWVVSPSDGGIAALWADCGGANGCRIALVSRLGDQVSSRVLPETAFPSLQGVPGGWLLETADGFTRVTPEGEDQPVYDTGGSLTHPEPGDTAVSTRRGWRLLRGDKLITVPAPEGDTVQAAYVTPAGRIVVAVRRGSGIVVASSGDGSTWSYTHMTTAADRIVGAVIAGQGDDVAVALLGDSPDGSIPVLQVSVSDDAGETWAYASEGRLAGGPGGLADLNGLAVGADGTTWLTTGSAGLVRVDSRANVMATQLSSHDRGVFAVADRVCLVTERGRYDVLSCSDDDGTTWVTQALPGLQ